MMEVFDNVNRTVRDDLTQTIWSHSRLSIAAASFSLYAYQELKKQLEKIDECRFIFTSPTFVTEKSEKEKREFYIPRLHRERSLYGTEFEVKLRNELTQRAIARECAEWIRRKVTFKSNTSHELMQGFMNVETLAQQLTYMPLNGFTTVDIGCDRGRNVYNMVTKFDAPQSQVFITLFNQLWADKTRLEDVTEEVINSISAVYEENPPELVYFLTLYHIFNEFLEDINEDTLPNEATGFRESVIWNKLYAFQRDAALGIINKLEQYNGCILADSVGLGKTFTALSVIKYYEGRNKNVLVLCPKKLKDNWMTYRGNLVNNPLAKDRLRYDILFHTDLSRDRGETVMGLPIDRINWGNYDLVVIDESHNFRNGGELIGEEGRENRYLRLMNRVIRQGVKTKVLMLSATPVNNKFIDLKHQLALAYEGEEVQLNDQLNTRTDIDTIFRQAQKVFNRWSDFEPARRTTRTLLEMLDFDFFKVLDSVTIARSRKHIQRYYDTTEIGTFPTRLPPISLRPKLTDLPDAANYEQIYEQISLLNLKIYTPTDYILASKRYKYELDEEDHQNINQQGRERGIQRLMSINLLKRMESSVCSFRMTVQRIRAYIEQTLRAIDEVTRTGGSVVREMADLSDSDFDFDDQNGDLFTVGKKFRIDLHDMDYLSWRQELRKDLTVFAQILAMIAPITPAHDFKLGELKRVIAKKQAHPINAGNQKIIIFTAFSDTAEYLYENIAPFAQSQFGLHTALVTGTIDGRTTLPKCLADMNTILTCFSPRSKERDLVMKKSPGDIDILIATDCISEGQNLQDCDYCINYDIHWNPVRIIQRFGRIDRIGSINNAIQLVNFWPDIKLDEYINLKSRVESRMRISVMTSTGDDDYINPEEKGDLEYRRQQLERLQTEVVDLEEMTSGISIMDLGLNDFRMDLLAYLRDPQHTDPQKLPCGIHTVVRGEEAGVIFVLKNVNQGVNIESQNRLHPFYLVYIGADGEVMCNHLHPKDTLDVLRMLTHGKKAPDLTACRVFNQETKEGRDMRRISELLQTAIGSIVSVKEESDIDSLFKSGGTSALFADVSGLDDFELICFVVVKAEDGAC